MIYYLVASLTDQNWKHFVLRPRRYALSIRSMNDFVCKFFVDSLRIILSKTHLFWVTCLLGFCCKILFRQVSQALPGLFILFFLWLKLNHNWQVPNRSFSSCRHHQPSEFRVSILLVHILSSTVVLPLAAKFKCWRPFNFVCNRNVMMRYEPSRTKIYSHQMIRPKAMRQKIKYYSNRKRNKFFFIAVPKCNRTECECGSACRLWLLTRLQFKLSRPSGPTLVRGSSTTIDTRKILKQLSLFFVHFHLSIHKHHKTSFAEFHAVGHIQVIYLILWFIWWPLMHWTCTLHT